MTSQTAKKGEKPIERDSVLRQLAVRTTLKKDRSWIQSGSSDAQEENGVGTLDTSWKSAHGRTVSLSSPTSPRGGWEPTLKPQQNVTVSSSPPGAPKSSSVTAAQREENNVSSSSSSPPSTNSRAPGSRQSTGYIIRGRPIDGAPIQPRPGSYNGVQKSSATQAKSASLPRLPTATGYKMSTDEYKKLAPFNTRNRLSENFDDGDSPFSPEEISKRSEAASSILKSSATKERSYVLSAAKRSTGSPTHEVPPPFKASWVEVNEEENEDPWGHDKHSSKSSNEFSSDEETTGSYTVNATSPTTATHMKSVEDLPQTDRRTSSVTKKTYESSPLNNTSTSTTSTKKGPESTSITGTSTTISSTKKTYESSPEKDTKTTTSVTRNAYESSPVANTSSTTVTKKSYDTSTGSSAASESPSSSKKTKEGSSIVDTSLTSTVTKKSYETSPGSYTLNSSPSTTRKTMQGSPGGEAGSTVTGKTYESSPIRDTSTSTSITKKYTESISSTDPNATISATRKTYESSPETDAKASVSSMKKLYEGSPGTTTTITKKSQEAPSSTDFNTNTSTTSKNYEKSPVKDISTTISLTKNTYESSPGTNTGITTVTRKSYDNSPGSDTSSASPSSTRKVREGTSKTETSSTTTDTKNNYSISSEAGNNAPGLVTNTFSTITNKTFENSPKTKETTTITKKFQEGAPGKETGKWEKSPETEMNTNTTVTLTSYNSLPESSTTTSTTSTTKVNDISPLNNTSTNKTVTKDTLEGSSFKETRTTTSSTSKTMANSPVTETHTTTSSTKKSLEGPEITATSTHITKTSFDSSPAVGTRTSSSLASKTPDGSSITETRNTTSSYTTNESTQPARSVPEPLPRSDAKPKVRAGPEESVKVTNKEPELISWTELDASKPAVSVDKSVKVANKEPELISWTELETSKGAVSVDKREKKPEAPKAAPRTESKDLVSSRTEKSSSMEAPLIVISPEMKWDSYNKHGAESPASNSDSYKNAHYNTDSGDRSSTRTTTTTITREARHEGPQDTDSYSSSRPTPRPRETTITNTTTRNSEPQFSYPDDFDDTEYTSTRTILNSSERTITTTTTTTRERSENSDSDPYSPSSRGPLFVKQYVSSSERSPTSPTYGGGTYSDDSERVSYSNANYSYSSAPRRKDEGPCTYCGRDIKEGAKIMLDHLSIYCHENCFKCGICNKPMGDLIDSLFIHRDVVHCEDCYMKLF